MRLPVTPVAFVLGLAGLIPFIACGLAAIASPEPQATQWFTALMAYGAVILAFVGGVHWGFVLAPVAEGAAPAARAPLRLVLGVLPSLIGWASVILPAWIGLPLQLGAFVVVVLTEARLRALGLVPGGYMALRWLLSAGVIVVLAIVLVVRGLGLSINL